MFQTKKPRFNLDLVFNELSNIPQISGYCYIELYIHDSTSYRSWLHATSRGTHFTKDQGSSSVHGSHIHVVTSKKKIHNFRVAFHENINCNLKFKYNRSSNMLGNKYLQLRVFYVPHHDSSDSTVIGKLDVNLTEYLNFEGPQTSKYLLKESKVNSILSLSVQFKELDPAQEFHTALTVTENRQQVTSPLATNGRGVTHRNTQYNLPQFDRKHVFGGLDNVIAPGSPSSSKQSDNSIDNASETSNKSSSHNIPNILKGHKDQGNSQTQAQPALSQTSPSTQVGSDNVLTMDPIVSHLYNRVLESTWDPALKPLLNYNPEKTVKDIFDGKDPDDHIKEYDDYTTDDDHSSYRNMNGLISETKLRDNLKSWQVAAPAQEAR
ncbi:hypothetical protein DIURU_002186 [Diutina rugosa]|uniref:C2 NT-type domain-containing protein n=1 Tax=Diutina rugosa TaxID=5481 RepID=A0A642UVC5_DIURU|nr:uncharacterized protein DIURU_002186 [Diutina rugosa]KAA8903675.1 hypothetical protein DIURU_002186 [Diutina rugosa]